MQLEQD